MAPVVQSCCLIWCRLVRSCDVRSRDFSAPDELTAYEEEMMPEEVLTSDIIYFNTTNIAALRLTHSNRRHKLVHK